MPKDISKMNDEELDKEIEKLRLMQKAKEEKRLRAEKAAAEAEAKARVGAPIAVAERQKIAKMWAPARAEPPLPQTCRRCNAVLKYPPPEPKYRWFCTVCKDHEHPLKMKK